MSTVCQLGESGHLHKDSYVLLNDGNKMPVLGLGTFSPSILPEEGYTFMKDGNKDVSSLDQSLKEMVQQSVKCAIDIGYRHIDGAYVYLTEHGIGQAFKEKFADGTIKREDLFYTSKLWNTFHQPHLVRPVLEKALKNLQLDYIDLYIIHMPTSFKALEKCKDAGLVRSIGVSNFNHMQLELILNKVGLKYKPVCNQIECHPYLNQKQMHEFCKSHDIVIVSYGVLGSPTAGNWVDQSCPSLLEDPVLNSIGKKYNKTSAQVSIRYILQRGSVALVKSFNPENMKQNIQIFDFHLTKDDMNAIDGLNRNVRYWTFAVPASIKLVEEEVVFHWCWPRTQDSHHPNITSTLSSIIYCGTKQALILSKTQP
ncbi:prostaglandin F synthase 1-like [Discoglossus pictus]